MLTRLLSFLLTDAVLSPYFLSRSFVCFVNPRLLAIGQSLREQFKRMWNDIQPYLPLALLCGCVGWLFILFLQDGLLPLIQVILQYSGRILAEMDLVNRIEWIGPFLEGELQYVKQVR